jgi:hypothetical protein
MIAKKKKQPVFQNRSAANSVDPHLTGLYEMYRTLLALHSEAEFLNVIGTKVLIVFLLAIHMHPPPPFEQKWFDTGL